jgi:hypothetical protein
LTESDTLVSECERHKAQLEALNSLYQTTEQIYAEAKDARGLEIAQHIKDEIQAARDHQSRVLEDSEQRVQLAIDRINHELGDTWPELASEMAEALREKVSEESKESQGRVEAVEELEEATRAEVREEEEIEESPSDDPFIRLCHAFLSYINVLRETGPEVLKRTATHGVTGSQLVERLSLHPGRMLYFMQPVNWQYIREKDLYGVEKYRHSNGDVEVVRQLIADEMRHLSDTSWQYRQRGF